MAAEVNTLDAIARLEAELQCGTSEDRRDFILAILRRWEVDPDLTVGSRRRAALVRRRFSVVG